MVKTPFRHKLFLMFFGVFLSLVILEAGLRAGGWFFLRLQDISNRQAIERSGKYRILCLGESTTALGGENAYPRQLERILNAGQSKIKFSVINKGIPAVTSRHIVSHLKEYLDRYKPQMVVSMIGINDVNDYVAHPEKNSSGISRIFYDMRIYKLWQLLKAHISKDVELVKADVFLQKLERAEVNISENPSADAYVNLAGFYRASFHPEKEEECLAKALKLDPKNAKAYGYLGMHYKRKGDYEKAVEAFKNALALMHPGDSMYVNVYLLLSECYKLEMRYAEAESAYNLIINQTSSSISEPFIDMGDMYMEEGEFKKASQAFEKAITLNPHAASVYVKLSHCYKKQNDFLRAEQIIKQGIEVSPKNVELLAAAGIKGAEVSGKNALMTEENYIKIYDMLLEIKIDLVAVQYPMRRLNELEEMLPGRPGIVFVDNYKDFKEAVAKEGYDALFTDRFAGDFGHGTPEGNRLLASNVAQAVLKKVMGREFVK